LLSTLLPYMADFFIRLFSAGFANFQRLLAATGQSI
jgi:hypothetical protein